MHDGIVGFVQPPYGSEDERLKMHLSAASVQGISTPVSASRAPPPSYDEAVAHMNDSMQDDLPSKSVQKSSSFPVHSVLNTDGEAGLYGNGSFLDDASQIYSAAMDVAVPSFRCQTDHFIVPLHQPSIMSSLAGDVCEASSSLNFVDGQSLNGSAFREVPPSSHRSANSLPLRCVQVSSSRCLHQPGDDDMTGSSDLLSPLTLLSSFTDNNGEEASQDCSDNNSNLSSVTDDIQPWRMNRQWQF